MLKFRNMGGFRDLIVWRKSIDLVTDVYRLSSKFPKHEIFALSLQIRRAAVSIPSNIAEGEGRKTATELSPFLRVAQGSLAELQTQLIIAQRLNYISGDDLSAIDRRIEEIGKLLYGLLRSTNRTAGRV
jgi:four helix bundle protein